MSLTIKWTSVNIHVFGCELSAYLAPISAKGLVTAWGNRHSKYRGGCVIRILWLGLVFRWGKRRWRYGGGVELWADLDTFYGDQ